MLSRRFDDNKETLTTFPAEKHNNRDGMARQVIRDCHATTLGKNVVRMVTESYTGREKIRTIP